MNFNNITFDRAYGVSSQLPKSELPEICFSGRSNVGKSSLINKLVSRKSLARVSTKPGKTITINFYKMPELNLVDLPGYGYAKIAFSEKQRFAELMENYFSSGRDIKLVIQLVDMRHDATDDDIDMINYLISTGYKFAIVLTKSDKLNKTEYQNRLDAFHEQFKEILDEVSIIPCSSQNGNGLEELKRTIESSL